MIISKMNVEQFIEHDMAKKVLVPLLSLTMDNASSMTLSLALACSNDAMAKAMLLPLLAGPNKEDMIQIISVMADKSVSELQQLPIAQVAAAANIADLRELVALLNEAEVGFLSYSFMMQNLEI